jgi:hypothetical protein
MSQKENQLEVRMKKSQMKAVAVADMEAEGMDVAGISSVMDDNSVMLMEGRKEKALRYQDENYSAEMMNQEAEIDELVMMAELGLGY